MMLAMKLSYRHLDYADPEDSRYLVRWYNDPELKHLISLFPDSQSYQHQFTATYFKNIASKPTTGGPGSDLMVLLDGSPIGEARFKIDVPKLVTKSPNTAWLSLIIGEHHARRKGLGAQIVQHLEQRIVQSGGARVEVAIFAYNQMSMRFFERLGYVEFSRKPQRAWWDGRLWDDVRLLKTLTAP